uniref:Ubiquitin-like domain-containing protein n=1 Tax=Amphimedon queenslandica TaxID=400682 RepID=A0A1X7UFE2_AMPQE
MAVAYSSSSDHLQLVAAALTSLIPGSKVITKNDPQYATLKDPKPLTYKLLSQNVIVESRPEPESGLVEPFEEIELDAEAVTSRTLRLSRLIATPVENMIMTVRFLNGQPYRFSVDPRATVYALKWAIFKSKGFDEYTQYDVNNIVLTFEGTELNDDDQLLTDYGIKYMSTVTAAVKLRGASETTMLVLEENLLDPIWDFDFTNIDDKETEYKRGGHIYKRPCGWNRLALKVTGQ